MPRTLFSKRPLLRGFWRRRRRIWLAFLWKLIVRGAVMALVSFIIIMQTKFVTLVEFSDTLEDDEIYDKQLLTFDGHLKAGFLDNNRETLQKLKSELQRVASPDNTILLVVTDKSVEEMALNFYMTSLKPFNITNYLFLSPDPQHCGYMQGQGISCFSIGNETGGDGLVYRSKEFIKRMNLRLETWISCIEMGFNILASDVDMTYLANPFPMIKSDDGKSYDLYFLEDCDTCINAGFMLLRATKDVVQRLQTALKNVHARPSVDDQQAINAAFQSGLFSSKIFTLPRSQFFNGRWFWEPGPYAREFRDEMKPCNTCVAIHNNWIITVEAKRYRARETGLWVVDNGLYYSDPDRMYLTYENPLLFVEDNDAREAEWNAIRSALAYAHILNRTLILPKFSCGKDLFEGRNQNCSFLHRTLIKAFEKQFPVFREHSFLHHELVPASTRSSVSPLICVKVSNAYVSHKLRRKCKTASIPVEFPDKGATAIEVLSHFAKSSEKILRFAYMYGVFSSFEDNAEDKLFEEKVQKSLVKCDYRQSCVKRHDPI